MGDIGKIGITPNDVYNDLLAYERMCIVTYNGGVYLSKQDTQGNLPTDTTNWMFLCKSGSMWYTGTGITGTSATPSIFVSSGVAMAQTNDMYLNTNTGNIYQCTLGGDASTATWLYKMTITGGGGGGTAAWGDITGKPFSSVGSAGLKVTSDVLDVDPTKVVLTTGNAATASRLQRINVTEAGAYNKNKWTKVGSFTASSAYKGYSAILAVTDKVINSNIFFMSINFRTGSAINIVDGGSFGFNSFGNGTRYAEREAAPSFKLVYTAPLFELWFNPQNTYLSPVITVINETTADTNLMTFYSNQPYQDTAPTGTVLACTPLPVTSDQLPTASSSVKGGIKVGDGLVIDSEIVRVDKYTFANVAVATTDFVTYTATLAGEADLTTAGYLQKAHIACTGVTSDYLANVVFGAVEADSGNYASVVTTEAGYVNIYAKAVPSSAITIPTIDCTYKGV